jgi:hypothetical protein
MRGTLAGGKSFSEVAEISMNLNTNFFEKALAQGV